MQAKGRDDKARKVFIICIYLQMFSNYPKKNLPFFKWLVRQLSIEEYFLFLKKTWIGFSAPT